LRVAGARGRVARRRSAQFRAFSGAARIAKARSLWYASQYHEDLHLLVEELAMVALESSIASPACVPAMTGGTLARIMSEAR
jgi:hypothetical protein